MAVSKLRARGFSMDYMAREEAMTSLSFHNINIPNHTDSKAEAIAYATEIEAIERAKRKNSVDHYSMIISWEGKESDETVDKMTHEYLEKNLPTAEAMVAVHQDTDNTHAHVWVNPRLQTGEKIHLNRKQLRELGEDWTRQYDQHYGTNHLQEFRDTAAKTAERKLRNAAGLTAEPESEKRYNAQEYFEEKEKAEIGIPLYKEAIYEQTTIRRTQQITSNIDRRTEEDYSLFERTISNAYEPIRDTYGSLATPRRDSGGNSKTQNFEHGDPENMRAKQAGNADSAGRADRGGLVNETNLSGNTGERELGDRGTGGSYGDRNGVMEIKPAKPFESYYQMNPKFAVDLTAVMRTPKQVMEVREQRQAKAQKLTHGRGIIM